ncbi:oxidoreductase [Massilia glaciei]|uniref:KR domain-containing protein n=1 Tax=Massilia glaciei TaxID=1524097 RepID=A0A2U2HN41_9BURK|nr:oxidoreductase [Massilia glaciei]PWF48931.1 KR domain-containing protein [Massilia glaciei]
MMQLEGKIVVVTGGAGLLGQQFCGAIAAAGGLAVVADRDAEAAAAVAAAIGARHPGRAAACALDITRKDSIGAAIAALQQAHGRIDAVVNNAYPRNGRYGRLFEDVEYDDFCENVSLHVGGYFLVSQQFARFFRAQGHGNIVNMSSVYGVIAPRFSVYDGTTMTMPVEYAVIKSGVLHLTRYMAKYLKGTGIRVNAISPGGIFDGQPESFLEKYNALCSGKGMLDKQDVAGTLLFLLSDASAFINGQNITVDDGFSL